MKVRINFDGEQQTSEMITELTEEQQEIFELICRKIPHYRIKCRNFNQP